MRNKIIALAKEEVGKYKEGPNNENPYGKAFDTKYWQFFNGKKSNVAYCAIFICWLFVVYFKGDLTKARKFLGCPIPANNCAAGVRFLHDYLKSTGTTIPLKDGKAGDIIFFRNDAHVGLIEKIANGYYHTIEANKGGKSSDCVARGKYKIGSSNITGIVRPAYPIEPENPTPNKPDNKITFPKIPSRGYFKSGDREPKYDVKNMQKVLEAVNPGCLKIWGCDGVVGNETLSAVAKCQHMVHVTVDEQYGPITNEACKKYLGYV